MHIQSAIRKRALRAALWPRYLVNRYMKGCAATGPPIFLVGCGHSGTSLLLRVLDAHSRIAAVPYETKFCFSENPGSLLRSFDVWAIAEGKPRWAEKTPRHIHCIDKLLTMRPDAKIMILIRDGRDVAWSIQSRTGDLREGINRWVEDNRAGQSYWNHPSVHVMRYEDMIESFEATISTALSFLSEEFEEGLREYHKVHKSLYPRSMKRPTSPVGANHEQYRNWQVNQPLFDGRGRWKSLTEDEKDLVKRIAGDMLIEYGYVANDTW